MYSRDSSHTSEPEAWYWQDILEDPDEVSIEDIASRLPQSSEHSHCIDMRRFIEDFERFLPGIAWEYAYRIATEWVFPIAKRVIRFDPDTLYLLMFPEEKLFQGYGERLRYMKEKEIASQLFSLVNSKLKGTYRIDPGYESAVQTVFYLSRRQALSVVSGASRALLIQCAADLASVGIHEGFMRYAVWIEASVLRDVLRERARRR